MTKVSSFSSRIYDLETGVKLDFDYHSHLYNPDQIIPWKQIGDNLINIRT